MWLNIKIILDKWKIAEATDMNYFEQKKLDECLFRAWYKSTGKKKDEDKAFG